MENKIEKEEEEGRELEEKMKQLLLNKMDDSRQLKVWKDLKELMNLKYAILNADANKSKPGPSKQDYLAL